MPEAIAKAPGRSDGLAGLPSWARTLAARYYTKTVSTFILYGSVRDLQPLGTSSQRTFGPLRQFLSDELFGARDHVLFYDRSSGIRGAKPQTQKDLQAAVTAYDALYGTDFGQQLPRDPGRALQILESYLRVRLADGKSLALIIDFAETLAPASELAHLSAEDRFVLTTLVKWAQDPQLLAGDVSIILLVENLAEMSPRLTRNPYVASVGIELPIDQERLEYVQHKLQGRELSQVSDLNPQALAKMTAGLSRLNLDRLLTEVLEPGSAKITLGLVKDKKKEILQAESHGLLEFIEPVHTLEVVAGHSQAKRKLKQAAMALKQGQVEVMPMGYLVSGPVGTGKTFLVTCFAGEIGIPCVRLLNFRSQWQGVTEANLEKIFNLLKAIWPVAVIVDEADAFLGNRDASGDSGTSSRVFAAIASFMGDTEYRGKIVWFLLTCRPDLVPIDLKRQGRAEEHIALFYPQTDAERDELFRSVARKVKVDASGLGSFSSLLPSGPQSLSGADIEAVLVRSKFQALTEGRQKVGTEDLKRVIEDFVPPSYPLEIELQNLAAVQECTSKELLPAAFRELKRDYVTQRIRELKSLLEEL